jgi:hypothetical protein
VRTRAHQTFTFPLSAFSRKTQYEPIDCPACQRRLWSHGFRERNLENRKIVLKRLRCPGCGKVSTIKPEGLIDFFQSLASTIYQTLLHRFQKKCWPRSTTRQRAGHWLRAFLRFSVHQDPNIDPMQHLINNGSADTDQFSKAMRY